jgi:hypothetical protein
MNKGESDEGYRTPAILEENLAGENAEECKGRPAMTIFLPIHCSPDTGEVCICTIKCRLPQPLLSEEHTI